MRSEGNLTRFETSPRRRQPLRPAGYFPEISRKMSPPGFWMRSREIHRAISWMRIQVPGKCIFPRDFGNVSARAIRRNRTCANNDALRRQEFAPPSGRSIASNGKLMSKDGVILHLLVPTCRGRPDTRRFPGSDVNARREPIEEHGPMELGATPRSEERRGFVSLIYAVLRPGFDAAWNLG